MIRYIYSVLKDEEKETGFKKKIDGQIKGLKAYHIDVIPHPVVKQSKLIRLIPFNSSSIDWKHLDLPDSDDLYIRYPMADYQFIQFLKRATTRNRIRKIAIEIPTYPYEKERSILSPVSLRDRIYRNRLKKYIERVFYIGQNNCDRLFGIQSTPIINGIDLTSVPLRKCLPANDYCINLLMVAHFELWHGIDRVVEGLKNYYSEDRSIRIILHLAGNGGELHRVKELVNKYNLKEYVQFHGYLQGEKLDRIYDQCDIGIASLGLHRIGVAANSTLKSREYFARGIPFIYSGKSDYDTAVYTYAVPEDDSPIRLEDVIAFSKRIMQAGRNEIAIKMRKMAEQRMSNIAAMKPVAAFFRDSAEYEKRVFSE